MTALATISDQSTISPWPAWVILGLVALLLLAVVASCVRLSGRDMPTPNAAPTEVALTASAARASTHPDCRWRSHAVSRHSVSRLGDTVWACLRCGETWTVQPERAPYDQEVER